jgi:hypothetical protein
MNTFSQALQVGVVLSAKDYYSKLFHQCESDLRRLRTTSASEAARIEKSLRLGQTLTTVGATMTAFGYGVSHVFENVVDVAGKGQDAIDAALITAGDQAGITREEMERVFRAARVGWGQTSEAVSGAMGEIGGRLDDYGAALQAIDPVAALARARTMDLGTAASMTTTLVSQFTDDLGKNATVAERYTAAGNLLLRLSRRLGGNFESLNFFLGSTSVRAKTAGQSLGTLGAVAAVLGKDATRLRTGGAAFTQILDSMDELTEKYPDWARVFPSHAATHDFISMLDDLKSAMSRGGLKEASDQLVYLKKLFGDNGNMVLYFIDNLDELHKEQLAGNAAIRETGKDSQLYVRANKQVGTWRGTQEKLNAQIERFKEMLGAGAIPTVKKLEHALGDITETCNRSPFWRAVLGHGFVMAGFLAELAKIAGPITGAIGLWTIYHAQQKTAIALQAALNAQTAAGAVARGAGVVAGGLVGAGATIGGTVATAVGTSLNLGGPIAAGIIAATAETGGAFALSQLMAKKMGVLTLDEWLRRRAIAKERSAPGPGNFIMPEIVSTAENPRNLEWNGNVELNITIDGEQLATKVEKKVTRRLVDQQRRSP